MVSNNDFQKAVELINKAGSILIATHTRPDGDACGSVAAVREILANLGKKTELTLLSPLPEWYEFLFDEKPVVLGENITIKQLKTVQFDLIILVDVNSNNQLPKFSDYLKQNAKPVLVIDHHVTNDGLGDVELLDSSAAATALIIFDLLKYANWPITEKIAVPLFVAVATDTGWFRFDNTDSRVHQACAELIGFGVNPTEIYHEMYQNFSFERFKLIAAMLETLELHFDGRLATQYIRQEDFKRTGAKHKDTENLIDECQRVGTVEVAALFVELPDGRIKCSLRSSGSVDVCKVATTFGGGGHISAAGIHMAGPLENAIKLIIKEVEKQLK